MNPHSPSMTFVLPSLDAPSINQFDHNLSPSFHQSINHESNHSHSLFNPYDSIHISMDTDSINQSTYHTMPITPLSNSALSIRMSGRALNHQLLSQTITQTIRFHQSDKDMLESDESLSLNQTINHSINQSDLYLNHFDGLDDLSRSSKSNDLTNSDDQSNNQSDNQSSNQSNNHSNNQSDNQSNNHSNKSRSKGRPKGSKTRSRSISDRVVPIDVTTTHPASVRPIILTCNGKKRGRPVGAKDRTPRMKKNQSDDQSNNRSSANQSNDQSNNQSINQTNNQSIDQSNYPMLHDLMMPLQSSLSSDSHDDQSINQTTNHSINQSNNQSNSQSNNQASNQSVNQSNNQSRSDEENSELSLETHLEREDLNYRINRSK